MSAPHRLLSFFRVAAFATLCVQGVCVVWVGYALCVARACVSSYAIFVRVKTYMKTCGGWCQSVGVLSKIEQNHTMKKQHYKKTTTTTTAWLVIIASNCPPLKKSEIEYYAMLAKTGVHHYTGSILFIFFTTLLSFLLLFLPFFGLLVIVCFCVCFGFSFFFVLSLMFSLFRSSSLASRFVSGCVSDRVVWVRFANLWV